jgi:hypothetical protein
VPQIKMNHASPQTLKTRPVIASPTHEPLVRGNGDTDYVCAGCDRVIAKSIGFGDIRNLVFECSGCGAFNRVP